MMSIFYLLNRYMGIMMKSNESVKLNSMKSIYVFVGLY